MQSIKHILCSTDLSKVSQDLIHWSVNYDFWTKKMTKKTGNVKGEVFLKHIPGEGCPDIPKRLGSIYSMLNDPDMQDIYYGYTGKSG